MAEPLLRLDLYGVVVAAGIVAKPCQVDRELRVIAPLQRWYGRRKPLERRTQGSSGCSAGTRSYRTDDSLRAGSDNRIGAVADADLVVVVRGPVACEDVSALIANVGHFERNAIGQLAL